MPTITVGASGADYTTIQAAINAAAAGDTISIAAGTYAEKVIVNKAGLNLVGSGEVNITGTFRADNGLAANASVSQFLQTTNAYTGATGAGVRVEANDVTLNNINVQDTLVGVAINGQIQNLTLTNVDVSASVFGVQKESTTTAGYPFTGAVDSSINGLTVNGGSITDVYIGMDFSKSSTGGAASDASNVNISGTSFQNITAKGIYAETLSTANLSNISMNHVGYWGAGPAFGTYSGAGIEINYKYGAYHDVAISNVNMTDVGAAVHANSGAIVVKTRGDASDTSYSGSPATWTGNPLSVTGGTINGTYSAVKVGESGKHSVGPNVTVSGLTVTGAVQPEVNFSNASLSNTNVSINGATGITTSVAMDGGHIWYADATHTIQSALTAAKAGDYVVLAANTTFTESLSVTKGVTLLAGGSNVVLQATGNHNAIDITGDLGGADVTIKGVTIQGVAGVSGSVTSGAGVYVAENANVGKLTIANATVKDAGGYGVLINGDATMNAVATLDINNSTFSNNGYNGTNGSGHIKLFGFDGAATLANLTLTGGNTGIGSPAVLPDYGIELTGQPNPGPTPSPIGAVSIQNVTVSGDFHKSGLALWNYANLTALNLASVNLSGAQTSWTPVFHTDGITSATQNASGWGLILPTRDHVTEIQGDIVTQPASNQTITGTAFNDWIMGKGGNDTLIGGGGNDYLYGADKPGGAAQGEVSNDTLIGGAGNDYLFGGAGNDTAVFSGARWQYAVTEAGGVITLTADGVVDGTDVVTDVEFFQFTDGVLSATQVLVPAAAPVYPDPPPTPSTPPPPNSGQGPSEQAAQGFENVTGNDADSTKSTSPTTTLPDGSVVPNESYQDAQQAKLLQQQYASGQITKPQLIDALVDMAIDTTGVALNAYQFFTGATPTTQGLAYLVNSPSNPNDLTDPYYAKFNDSNLYINFAVNLGTAGEGAGNFAANYGSLSFEDAIRKAYNEIIGNSNAQAKGINIEAAVQSVLAQQSYFNALGGAGNGAKAAMVGYLMYEGMKGHVGKYYDATHNYLEHAFDGTAGSNVNMLTTKLIADVDLFQ
jgi:hypothetical protein